MTKHSSFECRYCNYTTTKRHEFEAHILALHQKELKEMRKK